MSRVADLGRTIRAGLWSGKRPILYAMLALLVPLQAFALDGSDGPHSLDVQASLGGCGLSDTVMVCSVDASFNRVEGAQSYTARVVAPDGSVHELGTVAEGSGGGRTSARLTFPYAGSGSYGITVAAWGEDDGEGERVAVDDGSVDGDKGDGAGAKDGAESSELPLPPLEEVPATQPGAAPAPPSVEEPPAGANPPADTAPTEECPPKDPPGEKQGEKQPGASNPADSAHDPSETLKERCDDKDVELLPGPPDPCCPPKTGG